MVKVGLREPPVGGARAATTGRTSPSGGKGFTFRRGKAFTFIRGKDFTFIRGKDFTFIRGKDFTFIRGKDFTFSRGKDIIFRKAKGRRVSAVHNTRPHPTVKMQVSNHPLYAM